MTEQTTTFPAGVAHVSPPPVAPRSQHHHDGTAVGIALIVLGSAFIAARFVPGLFWWNLWPLLIVVGGFVHLATPGPFEGWGIHRVAEGAWMTLVGVVLLANTTGYVSWNVWWLLLSLWPVLLVALGIKMIGKGLHQSWLRAVAPAVLFAAMLFAVASSWTGASGVRPVMWNLPVQEWSSKHFDIRFGGGDEPISVRTY